MWPAIIMALASAYQASQQGKNKAPGYTPDPAYRELMDKTVFPTLSNNIKGGGTKYDTAGLERTTAEDIASQYGGAYNKVRSMLPYGNPGAMGRLGSNLATTQAQETSRATSGIRTAAEGDRIKSLMTLLGIASGTQDPNLASYYANMQKYNADAQNRTSQAGLWGSIAGLGTQALQNYYGGAGDTGSVSNYGTSNGLQLNGVQSLQTNPDYMNRRY